VPPHRVFSISTIFRRLSSHRDRETEFRQAGIELLGSSLPQADAEVVAVACRSLERAGLRGYRVGVGQISFFAGLLRALDLDQELQQRLTQDVVAKDLVNYRLVVEGADFLAPADRRALLEVPDLRGGPDVLDRAAAFVRSADMESALEHLRSMHDALVAYGYGDRLLFDLGIFRNLEYYTGSVFELYAPGMGFTLGGGGRYDNLLARFGAPMPAVGFGLGLDRLHAALIDQAADLATGDQTVILVGGLDRHVAMADHLREACVGVFALAHDTPAASAAALARQKEIDVIVAPAEGRESLHWTVTRMESGDGDLVPAEELVAWLTREAPTT
jgi:ATP phosphoribosyltransferase regulatory subunit